MKQSLEDGFAECQITKTFLHKETAIQRRIQYIIILQPVSSHSLTLQKTLCKKEK